MAKLYKDINTENIYTFSEIKEKFIDFYNCEIEPTDDVIIEFIHENLWSNGGELKVLTYENSNILKWCIDYSENGGAYKVLSTEEIENSLKDLYIAILSNDNWLIESIKENLYSNDTEDIELLKRLENLISV